MNDLLTDRLHQAAQEVAPRLRSPAAVQAVATRRRQRRRVVAGAVVAVAVGVVATSVQVENNADRLVPTTGRSFSPSPGTSPTSEPTPAPSRAPSPTPSTPSPAGSPSPTSGNPLAGFRFPEQKSWVDRPRTTVTLTGDRRKAWWLSPCIPTTAYPTDTQRVAMISLERSGDDVGEGRQVAVYPDTATAIEVMAGFRRALLACARVNFASGGSREFVSTPVQVGDEGLLVAKISSLNGRPFLNGGAYIVVRDGRSVYEADVSGYHVIVTGLRDSQVTGLIPVAMATLPLPQ